MWSKFIFVTFPIFVSLVISQNWNICDDGVVHLDYVFCPNAWYGFDYMRQYSHDVYYQVSCKTSN